ncbi:MAG: putative DNA binding domain-containing protein [Candidatus Kapabacteria bacterium]|nr:putative DNA binding domain-containing protein [Candidatus Kapabacteria bacterium]
MNRHRLKELIAGGESSTVEFKRKFTSPVKMAKEIAAFANTSGGWLIVGVDDNKKIYGVDSEKEQADLISTAAEFYLDPPVELSVEIINIEWKEVVVVRVEESDRKPHIITGDPEHPGEKRAYVRHNDESVLASKEMLRLLSGRNVHTAPMTLHIGDRERRLFSYLEETGRITVAEFADLVNISKRRASQILVRLVRADVLLMYTDRQNEYFTLA